MKTLYVSDLDETLLHSDETLSQFTVDTVNSLIERGMIFSYATARSDSTARKVTAGLSPRLPVIVYNGTFILENGSGKRLLSSQFSSEEAKHILDLHLSHGVYPMVRAFIEGKERSTYLSDRVSPAQAKFLARRQGDPRYDGVTDPEMLYRGEIFCTVCMDTPEKLQPLYEALRDDFSCNYFVDNYTHEQWLELNPKSATKASAIRSLKEILGCDRVVCFGNGKNDVSMFEIADECYAVGNAVEELKAIATDVIGTNDEDGVAKWLLQNAII
ncbi:MAG: HAD family hydrolase [Clostridia bacterium]|nr:HAD family hydrolase [Clostridia bacterium]